MATDVTEPRLRLGIVGCGAVVEQYHLPAVLASEDVVLRAVVDPSAARAEAVAQRTGATALSAHDQLLGRVDAAIVAVPNHLHAQVATELLRAGIHVLVEKPLAPTVDECDAIIQAAEASGATLAVGLDFRFAPAIQLVKALLDAGVLGAPRRFDLRHGTQSRWPAATSYLFDLARAGGGVLLAHGAHLLDHVLWWLGSCSVESYCDDARGGVEADAVAVLETAAGVRGTIELSRTRTLRNTCVIEGQLASVEVALFEPYAQLALRLTGTVAPELAARVGGEEFARRPYLAVFDRQLHDFVDAIELGRPPGVPGAEGRRAVALIEECYAVRRPLELPWDYPRVYEAVR